MPAGATYEPIETLTLSSAAPSVTFSTIAATYTDLVFVCNMDSSTSSYSTLTFNGVTGTSYSRTRSLATAIGNLYTDRSSNNTGILNVSYITAGTPIFTVFDIMNYANTSIFKTVFARDAALPDYGGSHVGLFRSTNAITSITLTKASGNYASGSTFTLYGIKAA